MRFWKPRPIKGYPCIGMVVATYRQTYCLRALLASLQSQTYSNFVCVVLHDGPADDSIRAFSDVSGDGRFEWIETSVRENVFGHNLRQIGFDHLFSKEVDISYICTTNGDGYYVPVYFEAMVHRLQSTKSNLVYCDMVHSHERNGKLWQPMTTAPVRGSIDLGCWMAASHVVRSVRWEDFGFAGDWTYFSRLMHAAGRDKVAKLDMTLYVHN